MRRLQNWFVDNFIRKFPMDYKGCKYFYRYDMSVDDWTSICRKNGRQVDDCDLWFYRKSGVLLVLSLR